MQAVAVAMSAVAAGPTMTAMALLIRISSRTTSATTHCVQQGVEVEPIA
jgi:hypothetical protein